MTKGLLTGKLDPGKIFEQRTTGAKRRMRVKSNTSWNSIMLAGTQGSSYTFDLPSVSQS